MSQDEGYDRELLARAIRRLNILEYFILAGAALLAVLGGALTAWLVGEVLGLPFRPTWFVSSFLLFVIPGAVVYARDHLNLGSTSDERAERDERNDRDGRNDRDAVA